MSNKIRKNGGAVCRSCVGWRFELGHVVVLVAGGVLLCPSLSGCAKQNPRWGQEQPAQDEDSGNAGAGSSSDGTDPDPTGASTGEDEDFGSTGSEEGSTGEAAPTMCPPNPDSHCHERRSCTLIGWGDSAHVALGDIDGDGVLDAAAVVPRSESGTSQLVVALGDGTGGFLSSQFYPLDGIANDVAIADLEPNGFADIVVALADPDRLEVRNVNNLEMPTLVINDVGPRPFALALADVTGNGSLEIISTDSQQTSGQVQIHNLIGERRGQYSTGNGPEDVGVADFDGDGDGDVVTVDRHAFQVTGGSTVALNEGNVTFDLRGPVVVETGHPQGVATGDFNGDGLMDYARAFIDIDTVYLVPGNGAGDFAPPIAAYPTQGGPTRIASADFDGDGYDDIVSGFADASVVRIFWGFAAGASKVPATFEMPSPPWDVATGDLNGDEIPDIVAVVPGGAGMLCPIVSAP